MIYDETELIDKIADSLAGEMTVFSETWFEFDDAVVSVTGYVQQDFRYEYSTDHFLLSGMNLTSRHADFDEIVISYNDADDYLMTCEELYYIEDKFSV